MKHGPGRQPNCNRQARGQALSGWERNADDRKVKLFRGRARVASTYPGFGLWLLRRITPEAAPETLTFAALEQVVSNAASLLCGAVYAGPGGFLGQVPLDVPSQHEAMLIAKRTADGFRAALDDRNNVVMVWPWEHLGTRVTWLATQAGRTGEEALGGALFTAAVTYALMHRGQLAPVFELWEEVTAGVVAATPPGAGGPTRRRLPSMGAELFEAYNVLRDGGASQAPATLDT